jgi:glycosyltransferase involved in cell wall biosynthesis
MISVVLSIFNEDKNPYFKQILHQFSDDPFFELLIIDGGSTDSTLQTLGLHHKTYLTLPGSTRGERLNMGLQKAKHPYILLHHPRSLIEGDGLHYLKQNYLTLGWAAFHHRFDTSHRFLKFISWYSNHIRVKKKKIVYLDHCIFLNQALLKQADIPPLDIFEDTALSEKLNKDHQPTLLPFTVVTSSIRFIERGIYKQFLMNQLLKIGYLLSMSSKKMNRLYEKKLNLNQKN